MYPVVRAGRFVAQPIGMVLRLATLGLCAASAFMLATLRPVRVELGVPLGPCELSSGALRPPAPAPGVTMVDVAAGVSAASLPALIRLGRSERIAAINEHVLGPDRDIETLIAALAPHTGEYLDVTVTGGRADRRVLMLLH
jgi:hypothetical protein